MHPSQQHQPTQQWPPPPGWGPPPKKNQGVRVALALGGVLLALIVLAVAMAPDRPAARTSTKAGTVKVSEAPAVSTIPRPDAQQAEDLLYGLRRIDKELDRARSIDRARDSCSNLLAGEPRADVVEKARQRFDGVAQINTAEARKIVALIEAGDWCQ